MIYEGTNEIQAIDLLVRKVLADGGKSMNALLDRLAADSALPGAATGSPSARFLLRIGSLRALTATLLQAHTSHASLAFAVADDYLRATALLLLDWAWLQIDRALPPGVDTDSHARWRVPAQALRDWVLPEFDMRTGIIRTQCHGTANQGG